MVSINGRPSPAFPLRGGLAQGSGASPLYWTIVLQPLTSFISSLAAAGRINPPPLPDGSPSPAVHAYADDTTPRLGSPDEATVVKEAFSTFEGGEKGEGDWLMICGQAGAREDAASC
jgi:hypothetical protein